MGSVMLNFDSNTSSVDNNGSRFEVQMNTGAIVPEHAKFATMKVTSASIYNNVNNISSSLGNNKLYFNAKKETVTTRKDYILTIPNGLYSLTDLNQEIQNLMDNEDVDTTSKYPFELTYNNVNKAVIQMNSTDCTILFSDHASRTNHKIRDLLGFTNTDLQIPNPASTNAPYFFTGTNKASFNTLEYFLITCNFVDQGLIVNNIDTQALALIRPNTAPGFPIYYSPYFPAILSADKLIGWEGKKQFSFQLKDNNLKNVDTNGETWSFSLQIDYVV